MGEKKRPGRFTIQFNLCDPKQKAVSDLLDQQGRSKAQFLTSAVLHYLNCPETPECRTPLPVDRESLEKLVLEILARNTAGQPQVEQGERKTSTEPLETGRSTAGRRRRGKMVWWEERGSIHSQLFRDVHTKLKGNRHGVCYACSLLSRMRNTAISPLMIPFKCRYDFNVGFGRVMEIGKAL